MGDFLPLPRLAERTVTEYGAKERETAKLHSEFWLNQSKLRLMMLQRLPPTHPPH